MDSPCTSFKCKPRYGRKRVKPLPEYSQRDYLTVQDWWFTSAAPRFASLVRLRSSTVQHSQSSPAQSSTVQSSAAQYPRRQELPQNSGRLPETSSVLHALPYCKALHSKLSRRSPHGPVTTRWIKRRITPVHVTVLGHVPVPHAVVGGSARRAGSPRLPGSASPCRIRDTNRIAPRPRLGPCCLSVPWPGVACRGVAWRDVAWHFGLHMA